MTRTQAIEMILKRDSKILMAINKLTKWDSSKTIRENCKALKLPNDASGYQLSRRYSLVYMKRKTGKQAFVVKNTVLRLKKSGFNMCEIGKMLGCSRQRIDQLLKEDTSGLQISNPRQQA